MAQDDPASDKAIGSRLKLVREARGFETQKEIAKALGVERSRWGNWENGTGPIPVPQATRFKELTGATLDYIYTGDPSSLPLELAKALGIFG